MANGEKRVDPRYAAQFQRGFEGVSVESPSPSPSTPDRIAPAHLGGGRAASAEQVIDRVVVPSRPPSAAVEDAELLEDPPIGLSVWPERALFVGGAALVLVSILLVVQEATTVTTVRTTGDLVDLGTQLLDWVRSTLPGPLLVGGIVAICGGFVLGALRSRRG